MIKRTSGLADPYKLASIRPAMAEKINTATPKELVDLFVQVAQSSSRDPEHFNPNEWAAKLGVIKEILTQAVEQFDWSICPQPGFAPDPKCSSIGADYYQTFHHYDPSIGGVGTVAKESIPPSGTVFHFNVLWARIGSDTGYARNTYMVGRPWFATSGDWVWRDMNADRVIERLSNLARLHYEESNYLAIAWSQVNPSFLERLPGDDNTTPLAPHLPTPFDE